MKHELSVRQTVVIMTIILIIFLISVSNQYVSNYYYSFTTPNTQNIAILKSVFTSTAYQKNGFYTFYADNKGNDYVTNNTNPTPIVTNLKFLNISINNIWYVNRPILDFFQSAYVSSHGFIINKNVHIISDINISNGNIFSILPASIVESFVEFVRASYRS